MVELPDVVGLTVDEARNRLCRSGWDFREVVTGPPKRPLSSGVWRVVRQLEAPDRVELVTALFPVLAASKPETSCD
ncbi:MAG: PASTA domain-containing protein [Armatimonadota bacterium]